MEEITIKVPAPFSGVSDLGFTARYPGQEAYSAAPDVPLLIEGPAQPMQRLMGHLRMLRRRDDGPYSWTDPVMLSDEVVVLAFRDRSLSGQTLSDGGQASASYVLNLVRPVVFAFLKDCAGIAHLRLSDVIEMRVSAEGAPHWEVAMPVADIVEPNGDRLLWQLAG